MVKLPITYACPRIRTRVILWTDACAHFFAIPLTSHESRRPRDRTPRTGTYIAHCQGLRPNSAVLHRRPGFQISDYLRDSETIPGLSFDATFFHTRTGRHYSLATAHVEASQCLNHLMAEVADLNQGWLCCLGKSSNTFREKIWHGEGEGDEANNGGCGPYEVGCRPNPLMALRRNSSQMVRVSRSVRV